MWLRSRVWVGEAVWGERGLGGYGLGSESGCTWCPIDRNGYKDPLLSGFVRSFGFGLDSSQYLLMAIEVVKMVVLR